MRTLINGLALFVAVLSSGENGPGGSSESKKREDSKMGAMVIVAYRPKTGKEMALIELVRRHHPRLKAEGLVTDRPAYAMRAKDGTVIEVFEWKSQKAVDDAHNNAAVQTMWKEFGEACDYVPLSQIAETKELFAGFTPIDLA